MSGIPTINVMVWGNLGTEPKLQSYGCLKIDSPTPGNQIWMNRNEASAQMVLNDKTVQRIQPGAEVVFPDALDVNDDYPFNLSFISKARVQCALLSYGQHKLTYSWSNLR